MRFLAFAPLLLASFVVPSVAVASPGAPQRLTEGVTAWVSAVPGADTVAVRLELALGLDAEGEGTWGLAALSLAALRDGPTRHLRAGEAVAVGARAGLVTRTAIARDRVAVTVVGPPEALPTALWLAAERLDPMDLPADRLAQLHARLIAAPDRAPEPPSPPLQHTFSNLFGPLGGHTPWASHQHAKTDAIEPLAAMVADALPRARARLMIAGPPEAVGELEGTLAATLAPLAPRPGGPPPQRDPSLDADWQIARPARVAAKHDYDSRRLVTVAWDLRGLAARLDLPAEEDEAIQRVLTTLLASPGGLLFGPLVDGFAVAREVDVHREDAPPALVVTATARGRSTSDARARLLDAMAPLGERGPPEVLLLGARELAATELSDAWGAPERRLGLVSTWWAAGRGEDPEAYYAALQRAIADVRPRAFVRWAGYALHESRRVIVELTPTNVPDQERVVLDADTLTRFLRILVDLRCPPPGRTFELVELLDSKYDLTPERYVALTRVVAREPERMRELNHEAEQRCLEYRKLRGIMPSRRVVALHRAVSCQAGRIADEERRDVALAQIYRRFDIDPSVYRPLLMMSREDPSVAVELDKIDAECPPVGATVTR